ncbi:peptide ABC transporter substrate-binding protein [Actinomycetota bacterium]|nr:peptide ABC transporter substrate-binding protein [Actinomycetota bacterium]
MTSIPWRRAAGAITLTLTLALAACTGTVEDATSDGPTTSGDDQTLTIGIITEPTSFDPAQAGEGHYIPYYQATYDTLILREPDGSLSPMLATQWEYDADLTALTLTLRDDVTFTDGQTFDADAVKTNLEHFQEANGPQAATLASLESVEVVDPTTVVLHLSEPDPALLIYLSNAAGFMASPAALSAGTLDAEPVGSGPYTLDAADTITGTQYTYVRNADYWGEDLPYATVVFKYFPDETARLNALKAGEVNAAVLTAVQSADEAERSGLVQVPGYATDWQGLTFFDRGGEIVPALADARVRQAINYAFDKDAMLKGLMLGRGTVTSQVFGVATLGFDEDLEDAYTFDPDKARELLVEAGYADGFTLPLPNLSAFDPSVIASIVQQLGDIGITVDLTEVAPADFFSQVFSASHPVTFMSFFQPTDWVMIKQFIAPDAVWNPFGTDDPVVSGLVGTIQNTTGDEQADAAQELNRYIVEQAWFAPFWRAEQMWFTDASTTVVAQSEQASPSLYNWAPAN